MCENVGDEFQIRENIENLMDIDRFPPFFGILKGDTSLAFHAQAVSILSDQVAVLEGRFCSPKPDINRKTNKKCFWLLSVCNASCLK